MSSPNGKKRGAMVPKLVSAWGAIALATCTLPLAACGAGAGASSSQAPSSATSAVQSTPAEAAKPAPSAGESLAYTWTDALPEGVELKESQGATAVLWRPVFAAMGDASLAAAADAMNQDAIQRVEDSAQLFNELAAHKPYGGVALMPEVTFSNGEYLAVHYYRYFSAGANGTTSIVGDGALYRLSDGAVVNPGVLVGKSDDELFALAEAASTSPSVQGLASPAQNGSLAEMFDKDQAGYVVLDDGVYLYLRAVSNQSTSQQAFLLVSLCSLDGTDTAGARVIDLASQEQAEHYQAIDRSGERMAYDPSAQTAAGNGKPLEGNGKPLEGNGKPQEAAGSEASSAGSDAAHQALVDEARAAGKQVVEGTIRIAVGEEAIPLSMNGESLFYANGESNANRYRSLSYAFISFDEPVHIENIRVADSVSSYDCPSVALAISGDEYPNFGDMGTWQALDGKRVCLAISSISQSSGTDFPGGPRAREATLLYEL